jgi:hypothetical protein
MDDHFEYHNHILPISDFFRENGIIDEDPSYTSREQNSMTKEQEQIIEKLMKKNRNSS